MRVHFHRKKAFGGSSNTGTVIVDDVTVGSAADGAKFDVIENVTVIAELTAKADAEKHTEA